MSARYAVYYVPEPPCPLEALGTALLGRDAAGRPVPRLSLPLPEPLRLEAITQAPAHYGLHATLKAPFELAEGCTVEQLCQAVRTLTADTVSLKLPPLDVLALGRPEAPFLALASDTASLELDTLAARCVCELDVFRAPLCQVDIMRRGALTPQQRAHLLRWGYPHVLENFRFHISLTDVLPDTAIRAATADCLRKALAPVCAPHHLYMRGVVLMHQPHRDAPFRLLAAFPLKN